MAMDFTVLVNPGIFKAHKKDSERMPADFYLYMKSFTNFLVVTDNNQVTAAIKKAILQAMGGPDIVFLFEYGGKFSGVL